MLYNESQAELKRKIAVIGFIFELVTPRLILEDNIEQEMQTFYDHFLLGICISDTKCTLKLWYHVIPQEKITLNMLFLACPHQQLFDQFHIAR